LIINQKPDQYLIYSPPGQTRSGAGLSNIKTSEEKKTLNPSTMNDNLRAMKGFYTEGGFTPIEGAKTPEPPPEETKSTSARQNETLMQQLGKNEKAMASYEKLSPEEKSVFDGLTSSRSYGDHIKDLVDSTFLNSKDEQVRKTFIESSPEKKEEIRKNFGNTFMNRGVDIVEPGSPPKIYPEVMVKLLEQGKLGDKDSEGKSLLENLGKMQNQKFASGLDGKEVFETTCRDVLNPDFITQGYKGTCTVTTLQHISAQNSPSEYTRLISGLTGEKGEVNFRNGDTIIRPEGLTKEDNSLRSPVDRIFQASMMQYAKGYKKGGEVYDNENDNFTVKFGPFKIKKDSGLNAEEVKKAFNAALPYESTDRQFRGNENLSRKQAGEEIAGVLSGGKQIPLALERENEYHMLSLEKMDGEFAYMRDPHGHYSSYKKGESKDLELSGGHIKMPLDEFYKKLVLYSVPS